MPGDIFKGIGKLAGGLFGSSQAPKQPTFNFFPNITTPSFNLKTSAGGDVALSRTAFPQRFPDVLKQLSDLAAEVRPGFGRFTEAAVAAIREAKGRALGTAREQLQRRRVAGSSFANAQIASIEKEFGVTEAQLRGQALLQEIQQTFQIIDQEFKVKTANFNAEFVELGIAADVAGFLTSALSAQAIVDKEIAAKAAAGTGEFFGDIGELIGGGLGDLFGGSGSDFFGSVGSDLISGTGGDVLSGDSGRATDLALTAAKLFLV